VLRSRRFPAHAALARSDHIAFDCRVCFHDILDSPTVRALVTISFCVACFACGGARQARRPPGIGTRFSASSLGSVYGIQARFEGSIAVQDRWVYVVVPTGAVRTYQRDRQDYWDLRLRAGLAECASRGFEVVSEGRPTRLAPLLGLSREAATLDTTTRAFRDTLRLEVGVPPGTDLAKSWVVLIFEWPFQNVMATYTVHTNVPLDDGRPWVDRQADIPGERCR
jgi:hypothetical protein